MPQFNQYPAPVLPLSGSEQLLLAQTQSGVVVSVTATVADLISSQSLLAGLAAILVNDGDLLIGVHGGNPVAATLAGTTNQVIVTSAAGSVTLSLPQDINPTASPTFAGVTTGTIDVLGAATIGDATTDVIQFQGGNSRFVDGGRLLVDTATDDGASDLQIGGTTETQMVLGSGQGALGSTTIRSWLNQSVTTAAVAITPAIAYGAEVIVAGIDGVNLFSDRLVFDRSGVTVVRSSNMGTSPALRTYNVSSDQLTLQMASGTYNVDVAIVSLK